MFFFNSPLKSVFTFRFFLFALNISPGLVILLVFRYYPPFEICRTCSQMGNPGFERLLILLFNHVADGFIQSNIKHFFRYTSCQTRGGLGHLAQDCLRQTAMGSKPRTFSCQSNTITMRVSCSRL